MTLELELAKKKEENLMIVNTVNILSIRFSGIKL